MDLVVGASDPAIAPLTPRLLRRMHCPLTGLSQSIGFVMRGALEPRLAVSGGELTGVHVLRGTPAPRAGSFHIGGSGTGYGEALIRTLGETLERYSHIAALMEGRHEVVRASYRQMADRDPLVPPGLRYFSDAQLARPGFPFARWDPDAEVAWVRMQSLLGGEDRWTPAQASLVGYVGRPGEPRTTTSVTTGSAAHTRLDLAMRNALLELVQIDSAMGHWYGNGAAHLLGSDARTRGVEEVVRRCSHPHGPRARFYWLPNADLPAFAVACVIEDDQLPRFAAGLGCDLRLSRAMYKAFLEGVAVAQLAKVIVFRDVAAEAAGTGREETGGFYDLDTNVGYYAGLAHSRANEKFGGGPAMRPADLPPDVDGGGAADVRHLVDGFRRTGKELLFLDLTTRDIRDLGFVAVRVWSPDTLALSLPSAPPVMHPRFQAYGGVVNEDPHPYP
jgi:thiazole/oxazole-forming peptide maturase SagD family component